METKNRLENVLHDLSKRTTPSAPSNLSFRVWNKIKTRDTSFFEVSLPALNFRFAAVFLGLAITTGLFASYFFVNNSPSYSAFQMKRAYSLEVFSGGADRFALFYVDRGSK